MKLLVIGAGGKTGEAIVKQAIEEGHTVTGLVHNAKEGELPSTVRVIEGDVLDAAVVSEAVAGQDAVLDALGGHAPWKETTLETNAARHVIEAMEQHGVRRLLVVSAMGVEGTKDLVPSWYEHLIMPTLLKGTMKDKEHMEAAVKSADLAWTLVRPAHLIDGEKTGVVHVYESGSGETAHKITRADVAAFMLHQLTSDTYVHRAVNIASK